MSLTVFKRGADGSQRDPIHGLSASEARDEKRFPLGAQSDAIGRFTYAECDTRFYARRPTAREDMADMLALGTPSAPLPSAAGLIAAKLGRGR